LGGLAFIFPGQGAQYPGMGKEIADKYSCAAEVFDKASEALGFDLKKMVFEGDEETLKITENTQPTVLTTSIACLAPLLEAGIKPNYTAGLSLGEYSAHVLSGTFTIEDAVKLVRKRGKYMQEAVPLGVGTMAAIIGLDREVVLDCCKEASSAGIVEPANFNCPGQIVVAGEVAAVEKLCELASERGAKRALKLPVSAPFHCSMLKPAGDKLAKELENIKLGDMEIPVLSNVNADIVKSKDEVKDLLIKQVSSPVYWEDFVRKMLELGVDTFVEIGPGKTLTGFMKRINRKVKMMNVEDVETLEKVIAALS